MMETDTSTVIASCRWAWCRQVFDEEYKLVKHVLDEHIAIAIPIKRRDIPLEKRAKDGTSFEDSIPTSSFLSGVIISNEEKDVNLSFKPKAQGQQRLLSSPILSVAPSGFGALDASSSPSPEPNAMLVETPSLNEIVSNTLHTVSKQPPSPQLRPHSIAKKIGFSAIKHQISMDIEKPGTNLSTIAPSQLIMSLEAHPEDQTGCSDESHSEISSPSQMSSSTNLSRRFRTGYIRLDPDSRQSQTNTLSNLPSLQQPSRQENTQVHSHTGSYLQNASSDLTPSHAAVSNTYVNDTDLFAPLQDPSIPLFSQSLNTFQSQSQYQLQTQAPYTFESQCSFDSQL